MAVSPCTLTVPEIARFVQSPEPAAIMLTAYSPSGSGVYAASVLTRPIEKNCLTLPTSYQVPRYSSTSTTGAETKCC